MEDVSFEAFLAWAALHGVSDMPQASRPSAANAKARSSCLGYKLVIADFPEAGGRGLAAARFLREGEVTLHVPKALLMSAESARADQQLGPLLKANQWLSSNQALVLHLLHEVAKGKASFWRPYLQHLPRTYHTLANFELAEAQAFQVPEAIAKVEAVASAVRSEWTACEGILHSLGLKKRFRTLEAWLWAHSTVSSRALYVPWDAAGTLCPVGDLFNYAPPDSAQHEAFLNTAQEESAGDLPGDSVQEAATESLSRDSLTDGGYSEAAGGYRFYARSDYKVGEQVLLCYGSYTNLELLEHYGFLLVDNPSDDISISVPQRIWPADNTKQQLICNQATAIPGCHICSDGSPSFALLTALRLRAADPLIRKKLGHLAASGQRIAREGDVAVYSWLKQTCEAKLAGLPSIMQDDEECTGSMEARLQGMSSDADALPSGGCERNTEGVVQLSASGRSQDSKGWQDTIASADVATLRRLHLAVSWRKLHKRTLMKAIAHCTYKLNVLDEETHV